MLLNVSSTKCTDFCVEVERPVVLIALGRLDAGGMSARKSRPERAPGGTGASSMTFEPVAGPIAGPVGPAGPVTLWPTLAPLRAVGANAYGPEGAGGTGRARETSPAPTAPRISLAGGCPAGPWLETSFARLFVSPSSISAVERRSPLWTASMRSSILSIMSVRDPRDGSTETARCSAWRVEEDGCWTVCGAGMMIGSA